MSTPRKTVGGVRWAPRGEWEPQAIAEDATKREAAAAAIYRSLPWWRRVWLRVRGKR